MPMKNQHGLAETKRIKEIYEQGIDNIDDVYATLENNNKEWSSPYINTKQYIDSDGNIAWIPSGFQVCLRDGENKVSNGLVIRNADDLNEFVWIPCTANGTNGSIKYDRYDFGIQQGNYSNYTEEDINIIDDITEINSIQKYKGYYIGRYEAGIKDYTDFVENNSNNLTEWTGYRNGKLVIQKGQQIWNYITRDQAIIEAKKLYTKETNGITSKLCSSYAWDTALKFIEIKNPTYPTNSTGGNYSKDYEGGTGEIQKTGYHQVNNIYDMGGNAWNWTTETYTTGSYQYIFRGGEIYYSPIVYPASARAWQSTTYSALNITFRVALFL